MKKKKFNPAIFMISLLLLWALSFPAAQSARSNSNSNQERWEQLSPAEKTRIIRNYNRWKSLPPDEQKKIRERFTIFHSLSPKKQQELRRRAQQK